MAETELAYLRRLGVRSPSKLGLVKSVQAGLPYKTFERLQADLEIPASELAEVVRISFRTLTRRREAGRFQPDESDRILRIARLVEKAVHLFEGDRSQAKRWFTTPKSALSGDSPLQFSQTEVGAREVEALIDRLEHGVFS
jgi:putative toxin-antitoxin system antitoxin component (TIGR02293 family)